MNGDGENSGLFGVGGEGDGGYWGCCWDICCEAIFDHKCMWYLRVNVRK